MTTRDCTPTAGLGALLLLIACTTFAPTVVAQNSSRPIVEGQPLNTPGTSLLTTSEDGMKRLDFSGKPAEELFMHLKSAGFQETTWIDDMTFVNSNTLYCWRTPSSNPGEAPIFLCSLFVNRMGETAQVMIERPQPSMGVRN